MSQEEMQLLLIRNKLMEVAPLLEEFKDTHASNPPLRFEDTVNNIYDLLDEVYYLENDINSTLGL